MTEVSAALDLDVTSSKKQSVVTSTHVDSDNTGKMTMDDVNCNTLLSLDGTAANQSAWTDDDVTNANDVRRLDNLRKQGKGLGVMFRVPFKSGLGSGHC